MRARKRTPASRRPHEGDSRSLQRHRSDFALGFEPRSGGGARIVNTSLTLRRLLDVIESCGAVGELQKVFKMMRKTCGRGWASVSRPFWRALQRETAAAAQTEVTAVADKRIRNIWGR